MDRAVYDRMSEIEADHWWFSARRDIIRRTIERYGNLPPEPRLLEAGCGTGGNLEMLATFGDVDAFEFDDAAREIAAEKSGLDIPFGALPEHMPHGSTGYNMIGLFDVLEHIEDDAGSLAALAGRLRPGGRILVTVPAFKWLWSQHDDRHHHFRRYSRATLGQAANDAGLTVEHSFYFNTLLLPVAITTRGWKSITQSNTPDDSMPAAWLNTALYRIFASERHLIGRLSLPVGLSICGVMTPPGAQT